MPDMTHAPTPICFAGQQSYALEEDQVLLQAELALTPPGPCAPLALQLWAARADDAAITIKLAELPVTPAPGRRNRPDSGARIRAAGASGRTLDLGAEPCRGRKQRHRRHGT
jgi:hypothetical protein